MTTSLVQVLWAEVFRSWRAAVRRPGFLFISSLTLALGLSATLVVYALIDGVLLRPLPYPDPARLVVFGVRDAPSHVGISPQAFQGLGDMPQLAGRGIATQYQNSFNVSSSDRPELVPGISVNRGFLATLAPKMTLGRNFVLEEDQPNGPRAVILSHGFWTRHFGGDLRVTQRSVSIEGISTQIVGVLPKDFRFTGNPDLFLPLALDPNSQNGSPDYFGVARLAAGANIDEVNSQVAASLRSQAEQHAPPGQAERVRNLDFGVFPLRLLIDGESGRILRLFLASGLCVLLIAFINLANLTLLRVVSKSHESAVRSALGADGVRLALPTLSESLLIAVVGSLIGLLLAKLGLSLANETFPPEWLAGANAISLSPISYALAFVLGMSGMLLSAFFGLRKGRIVDSSRELAAGSRTGLSRGAGIFARSLVVAQLAIAVVLLCGAALLGRTLYGLVNIDLGIASDEVLTFEISPLRANYAEAQAALDLLKRTRDRIGQLPGVEIVGAGTNFPLGSQLTAEVTIGDTKPLEAQLKLITPGYLGAFSIPIKNGRDVSDEDKAGTEPVALVNQSYANQYFSGDAVGQSVSIPRGANERVNFRVIGVTGDVRTFGPQSPPPPTVYLALAQQPSDFINRMRGFIPFRVAVRVKGDPSSYVSQLHVAIAEIDPRQPIAKVLPASRMVDDSVSSTRLNLTIVGVFAGLALVLASVGLYAIISVVVAARTREFGVRMALGATPSDISRLVLGSGLRQAGVGIAVGMLVALVVSKALESFLFGVSAVDPISLIVVAVTLVLSATVACLVPSLRGARVHPMVALHSE